MLSKDTRNLSRETKINIYKSNIMVIKGKLGQNFIEFGSKEDESMSVSNFLYFRNRIHTRYCEAKEDDPLFLKSRSKSLTQGFTIDLELKGVGYQARIVSERKRNIEREMSGASKSSLERNLEIKSDIPMPSIIKGILNYSYSDIEKLLKIEVGFSHAKVYPLNQGDVKIDIVQRDYVTLKMTGINRNQVNRIAAEICMMKKPEPYKGKGIRYKGVEYIGKKSTKKKT